MSKSRSVTCPTCGESTFPAQMCIHCGSTLIKKREVNRDEDYISFVKRARHVAGKHSQLRMVQLVAVNRLADGSLPGIKKLTVREETSTLIVLPSGEFRELTPGDYEVSELGIGGGLEASFRATTAVPCVFFCSISKHPIVVDVVLPDGFSCGHEESVESSTPAQANSENLQAKAGQRALRSLSLRTADNMLGGVAMQMVLRCTEPVQLISTLAMARLHESPERYRTFFGDKRSAGEGGVKAAVKYPLRVLNHLFTGSTGQSDAPHPVGFDLFFSSLYKMVRMELASSVIESIRNETVHRLYDEVAVRERVADDIKRVMLTSMQMYGLDIERVTSFRFTCPEFEELLRRRGDLALAHEQLRDDQDEHRIGQERRRMGAEDAADLSRVEAQTRMRITSDNEGRARHAIDERRATRERAGKLISESQQRKMARHAALKNHGREQKAADERLAISLQNEKLEMLLELNSEMNDRDAQRRIAERSAEVDNRIRLLEAYGRLPKDMTADTVLAATLAENPVLAQAFSGIIAAKGRNELVERERLFQEKLLDVYKENSQPYNQVWQEVGSFLKWFTRRQQERESLGDVSSPSLTSNAQEVDLGDGSVSTGDDDHSSSDA